MHATGDELVSLNIHAQAEGSTDPEFTWGVVLQRVLRRKPSDGKALGEPRTYQCSHWEGGHIVEQALSWELPCVKHTG